MLELVGGKMNPGPDWALSVAELERLGLSGMQAKHVAGVPPQFALDGQWVMLVDDEPLEPARARVITIDRGEASCSRGSSGMVARLPRKALVQFKASSRDGFDECIVISTAQSADFLMGMTYTDHRLPDGDPGALWRAREEASEFIPDEEEPMAKAAWLYRLGTVEEILSGLEQRTAEADPSARSANEGFAEWGT